MLVLFHQIIAILEIYRTLKFYQTSHFHPQNIKELRDLRIVVIIPVLRENSIIAETIAYFEKLLPLGIKLIVVTTEREDFESPIGHETTREVLIKLSKKYKFTALHYPDSTGFKVDQINFAIDWFMAQEYVKDLDKLFFCIYDADSRPCPSTFLDLINFVHKHPEARIIQQSASFYANLETLLSNHSILSRLFLPILAIHQTRFTLCFEVPRYRRKLARHNNPNSIHNFLYRSDYTHCVGHGLFLRSDLLKKFPLPHKQPMEDLYYGYIISCVDELIYPLPSMEIVEEPTTLSMLNSQKARWFSGLSQSFKCIFYTIREYGYTIHSWRVIFVVIQSIYDLLTWCLVGPWIVISSLLSITIAKTYPLYALLNLLGIAAYGISFFCVASEINSCRLLAGTKPLTLHWSFSLQAAFLSPVIALLHSTPAWCVIGSWLLGTSSSYLKTKTERN